MSAPLSKDQKRYLSQLATRAFARDCALARGRQESPDSSTKASDDYRRAQVALATGKLGLRCCSQDDYKLVEGHFLELLGHHGAAFNAQVKAATESRRVIEHKIVKACEEFGFSLSYANKICTAQNHGAGLDVVDEKKLWQIFYTIRNRGAARRRATIKDEQAEHQLATSNLALA